MKKLKRGKVIAASLIAVLLIALVAIIKIASIDKYAGLVKVNNASLSSISTKLSANISDLSEDNNITVKGYDEIDYNISYTLSDYTGDRDVIINAKLDDNERYASFKEVTGNNIASVLSSNRKEITITISNLPSGQTINSKVTMIIENAPNGYEVRPTVRIKESTGVDYTNITVKPVTVNTSSLIGSVIDEDGNIVPNILISLKKNNDIIKETYTSSEGKYTFSDITPDTYSVVVNEENYENLELNNIYIENGNMLNLIVKKVYPYKIETNKYITKVELSNLGSSKDYIYNDVKLANIPVKKVNDLHGKIYYKITVQNTGEKAGIIAAVKDELPEGLSFDESLNSGYELKNGIIYNRNLEGVELSAGEMISDTLVLTIENTDVAKTYINKVNAKGELYEHVVYLIDGRTYKTLDVLEGETIDEPTVSIANFNGWYTDEKLTNKYKFELPVEKDLILYGVTQAKHTVVFNDKHPETLTVTEYDRKTVNNGDPVSRPNEDPGKTGYDFCGWVTDSDVEWDFNTPVTSDLTLTSKYCIKSYDVEFYDKSASNGAEYAKISTLSKEYKTTVTNSEAPDLSNAWTGHNFLRWTTDPDGQSEYDFTSLITGPVKLYAQYSLQERSFIFNDENRITEKTVDYGATVNPIADQGKEGHTFKYWSESLDGEPYNFSTPIYVTTTVYAVYQINTYNVIFNDTDPWTNQTTEYDNQAVDYGNKATEPAEPSKEGHTFCGWKLNGNDYDFDTPVTGNITLESCYTKNKVNVYFMNGTDIWETKQVEYADTVNAPATNPVVEHKIFNFWSEDGTNAFDYSTQIKEDKYLYATFDDITAPTITHTPLYWTNDKVLVTITHNSPVLTFKYKVDDETYQDYTEPFELSTNSTITAKSIYEDSESEIATHEVTNIDKLNPTIGDITSTSTQTTILLSGIVSDNESGVMQIKVYNGNVLVGTVNGTANNAELRDYQKSRDMNIVVSDLTLDTEYTFRIEVTDGAGNVTEDTMTARTSPEEPICQIISVDGVDLNPEDYMPFTLLELAIEDSHCESKCTIQMLKSTNESVEVLDTQDITLDLNGKTVAGVLPGYTINNQGEFTLIDHGTSKGGIVNGSGIGIFNNTGAKLTLGEGSSEAPVGTDTRAVYQYPYVFGETYGIYSERNAEFLFFDGKIRSNNAVQGEVTETEYAYNATSNMVTGYEEVTLAIQAEPEARINKSKYYANFTHAVPDTNGGTVELETSQDNFLEGFTHVDSIDSVYQYNDKTSGYPFIYDPDNNTLTSSNLYYGSMAFTETIIDLTDSDTDQILDIRYHIDPNHDGSYGTANLQVMQLDSNYVVNNGSYNSSTGSTVSTLYALYNIGELHGYKLAKGNKYKVKFSFQQPLSIEPYDFVAYSTGGYTTTSINDAPESKLVITSVTMHKEDINDSLPEIPVLEGNTKVAGFYYDSATDTIRSNTQYSNNPQSLAYGYVELDLTDYVGTYELTVAMSVETAGSSDNVLYLTEDVPEPRSYSSTSSNMIVLYSYSSSYDFYDEFTGAPHPFVKIGPLTSTKQIQGGKKYYLNFTFYRYMTSNYPTREEFERYNISDQMIINSIKVYRVSTNPEDLDIVNNMVGNGIDFENPIINNNNTYYSLLKSSRSEYHDSYIKLDLTNSPTDKVITYTGTFGGYNYGALYITKNNRGLTTEELINDRSKVLMYKDDYYSTANIYFNYMSGNDKDQNFVLEKGNVYYLHFNQRLGLAGNSSYRNQDYYCEKTNGECGTLTKGMSIRDVAEVVYSMGKTPINEGTVDMDSLEEDTENDITLNQVNDIPNIYNTFEVGYVWDDELQMYTLERELNSYEAAAWVGEVDMTNETQPKQYKFVYQYAQNYDISYYEWYTVDELHPVYYYKSGYTPSRDYSYNSYNANGFLNFEPGHKYYVYHFVYRYTNGLSHKDAFRFEEVNIDNKTEYTKGEKIITFNEKVDEVQILKNITASTVTVDYNKEMILDLNGYTLTGSITNNGKLTIIDSDYENQTSENKTHNGKIQNNTSNGIAIKNNHDAELIIKNVRINIGGQTGTGIDNYGTLSFETNYDSKIYVNSLKGKGIWNRDTGSVNDTSNSMEIVMNYRNQSNYTSGSLYRSLGNSIYTNDAWISVGIYNEGFYNASGMKITGKHGTGFYNRSMGTAVIRTSNISVDINAYDKTFKHDDYSVYNYLYQYGSTASAVAPIKDYSVRNDGVLTLKNGTNIGTRTYNGNQLFATSSVNIDYIDNESKFYATSGTTVTNALSKGEATLYSGFTLTGTLDNYGDLQFKYDSSPDSSIVNNHENGVISSDSNSFGELNNYDNGYVKMINTGIKHLVNDSYVSLSTSSVNPNEGTYNEAVLNRGVLDLEYGVSIGNSSTPAKYGILLEPKGTGTSSKPYQQVKVNIGTPNDQHQTNTIYGDEIGVTGPCYRKPVNPTLYYSGSGSNRYVSSKAGEYIQYEDGTKEVIDQSNYDQDLCIVNLYTGFISSKQNPGTYNRTLSIPVNETIENSYSYWRWFSDGSGGLAVVPRADAPSNINAQARIGSTEYTTIQDAIDSVPDSTPTTIDVIKWAVNVDSIIIPEGKSITLNFESSNNWNSAYYNKYAYINNGNLTLTGDAIACNIGKYLFVNNGTLTINNGKFYNEWTYNKMERSALKNNGTAVINNGLFRLSDINNFGDLTINNGEFPGTMVYGTGDNSLTTVKGGYFSSDSDEVDTYYAFKTAVKEYYESSWRYIFEVNDGAKVLVDGLDTVSDTRYTYVRPIGHVDNATLELKDTVIGQLSDEYNPMRYISAENGGNIIFDSGTYDNIYLDINGGKVTVNGGNFTAYENSSTSYNLIYLHGDYPQAEIYSGILNSKQRAVGLSDYSNGYNIVIGTKDDKDENDDLIVSKTTPMLVGDTWSIAKYGSGSGVGFTGFYDGILKGKSGASDINFDEIEDDYEIIDDTDSPYVVKYLDQKDLVKNVTTGEIYKSFQKAFNEATNGDVLETLRSYTNTKTTSTIVIPETSNFTLNIKHPITVNNEEFIINNGTATFNTNEGGHIAINVASNVFINNGNLTLSVELDDLKSDGVKREIILNNETGTLNINNSTMTTVQRIFVTNHGIFNMDTGGTEDSHTSSSFTVVYVPGDGSIDYAFYNDGTANIDYMTLISQYIAPVLYNKGSIAIDHSTIDQSGIEIPDQQFSLDVGNNIQNYNIMSIKNSYLTFAPSKVGKVNQYYDFDSWNGYNDVGFYIGNYSNGFQDSPNQNAQLLLENNTIETSILGLVYQNGFDGAYSRGSSYNIEELIKNIPNRAIIKDCNVHNMSYGIRGEGYFDIQLTDSTFNIRESIVIGYPRYNTSGPYTATREIDLNSPLYHNSSDTNYYYRTMAKEATITIDGGTYTTNGYVYYDNYTTNSGATVTMVAKSFMYKVAAIENNGTLVVKDATIDVVPLSSTSNHQDTYYEYYNIYKSYVKKVENLSESKNICYYPEDWLGAINTFGPVTIINSEINDPIRAYTDRAIITLGEKDGEYNNQKPLINSKGHQVPIRIYKGLGSINFYDGIISTTNNSGIQFSNNIEDLDKNFSDLENGYIISGTNKTRILTKESIIKNVTQDIGYTSVQEAINDANNNDELIFLKPTVRVSANDDATITGKTLTIDTNCKTIANHLIIGSGANISFTSSACSDGRTESNIDLIEVTDDGIITLREGKGTVNTHDNSVLNLTGSSAYNINSYDNTTINVTNNTTRSNEIIAYNDTIVNVNDGLLSTSTLNDDTTLNVTCSVDNNSSNITGLTNSSNTTLQLSCGILGLINNGTVEVTGGRVTGNNYGTMVFDDHNETGGGAIFNNVGGTITINNGTFYNIHNTGSLIINGGTFNAIQPNAGTVTINGGTIAIISHNSDKTSGNVYIHDGLVKYMSVNLYSARIYGGKVGRIYGTNGNIFIGEKDGIINTTSPEIDTKYYNTNPTNSSAIEISNANIYFNDGIITGSSSYGVIRGSVAGTEEGYKVGIVNNGDGTETAYLTPITVDDSLVAVVNGINYNSLQQAVNKSILNCEKGADCPSITVYHNLELDADITVPDGYTRINIISNGYTLSTNGFHMSSIILWDGKPVVYPEDLGGNILNGIRGMLGLDDNKAHVLVYEMSDGSALSTEGHYRLYEYKNGDYELVTMEKGDEVARYTPGRGITNMKPIKGRLYLTNLEPGSYKVTDDNGSELTFIINDDLTLSGHVKEYVPSSNRIESTGEAKLLISIQTGIRKINYMFIAISIIVVLSVMFVIRKKRENS